MSSGVSCCSLENCFPALTIDFSLPSKDQIKDFTKAGVDFAGRSVVFIALTSVKVIKNAFIITVWAASKLAINILAMPLYAKLPSVNSVLSEKLLKIITYSITLPASFYVFAINYCLPQIVVAFDEAGKRTVNYSLMLAIGMGEELFFRVYIQSLLLRDIPRDILHKFAPAYENYVDHKITKIARVVFTSALFALAHASVMGDNPGFLVPQFFAGLTYGIAREYYDTSLWKLGLVHATYDAIIFTALAKLTNVPMSVLG